MARNLEMSDLIPAEIHQLIRSHCFAWMQLHPGANFLTEPLMRHAEHLNLGDLGMPVKEFFNLAGINVLSTAYQHVLDAADGSVATHLLGTVGAELTAEQGMEAARLTALAMIGTLQRELGELSRVKAWTKVLGMVNSAPDFTGQTPVINAFSELVIDVFGAECGTAARSAVGMASLPMNIPVEVEAILELSDP